MKNVLNQPHYEELVQRINSISATSERRWGAMTPTQMLQHCVQQLKLALGQVARTKQGPWIFHTWLGKKIALSGLPWNKGMKAPQQMITQPGQNDEHTVHSAKKEFLQLLQAVLNTPQLQSHPYFENMSHSEWGRLIWKHTDYHLKQFSA
jgi:hypothetical protein